MAMADNTGIKKRLETQLWSCADALRGSMDSSEYQKYISGLLFYKYVSEREERTIRALLEIPEEQAIDYEKIWNDPDYEGIQDDIADALGYVIEPQYLFSSVVSEIRKKDVGSWSTTLLETALNSIPQSTIGRGEDAEAAFRGLFDDIDVNAKGLGNTLADRDRVLSQVLLSLDKIDLHLGDAEIDVIGDAYEYLIGQFAAGAGKKGGEFYTPQEVSELIALILNHEKPEMKNAYDPTCGSGSLLLRIAKHLDGDRQHSFQIFGQEKNSATANLAKQNMILHGVRWSNFHIKNDDTLYNDRFSDREFDAITANPPYSLKWEHTDAVAADPRFSQVGKLAPKDKADFAFVQHIIYHLTPGGTAAVVLPHGVLFRTGAEQKIREYFIKNHYIRAIIGLPANLFYGTGIPTCIIVLQKPTEDEVIPAESTGSEDADEDILFIDASKLYVKGKNQNSLGKSNLDKIFATYTTREDVAKLSKLVKLDEITKNDYNLNITRYVDSSEDEVIIDLDDVHRQIAELRAKQETLGAEISDLAQGLYQVS